MSQPEIRKLNPAVQQALLSLLLAAEHCAVTGWDHGHLHRAMELAREALGLPAAPRPPMVVPPGSRPIADVAVLVSLEELEAGRLSTIEHRRAIDALQERLRDRDALPLDRVHAARDALSEMHAALEEACAGFEQLAARARRPSHG